MISARVTFESDPELRALACEHQAEEVGHDKILARSRADDRELELVWRIRAAQEAGTSFAAAQEVEHWKRVLDLWDIAFGNKTVSVKATEWDAANDRLRRVLEESLDGRWRFEPLVSTT